MRQYHGSEVFNGIEPDGIGSNFKEIVNFLPLLSCRHRSVSFEFNKEHASTMNE